MQGLGVVEYRREFCTGKPPPQNDRRQVNLTLGFVSRGIRAHTPLLSYLSTSLRYGRDDAWEVCATIPTVISSKAEKYDRPGVWGRIPAPALRLCSYCGTLKPPPQSTTKHRKDRRI